ncbi:MULTISPECIES: carbohydrate ABC transporter permease [Streptomyces]|uniref:N,N'-diacetylchitobiose transport system permease protein n=2 Tax=Streptomyces TaxID=1883 RepID=A0ABT9KYB0_9ACTN|nr:MULTISPECIES: carbohydrate ABC transporter permease [Streptomyces]MBW8092348.1 carbohydrate ABC transporter permease [Streptomyces hygroscopicus subsp. hygroscopicus]MCO8303951.1 carbohydrate ABC transporter permease [Streptomyces sp. RKCA744]MDN3053389.1 carbohydrate ABC transporter permease [Streptomyces sp. SRF1]MDP9613426.1 N,N'-diacetylchitobiose transport system permease protein [Streptomyces demainii]GHJ31283.1 sugar ABC transporter permease [Streptomyces hygroscopicus]
MKRSPLARLWPGATAVVLFIGFAFPVYWMFTTAFKPTSDVISEDPVWFPTTATLEHFQKAVDADHFWTLVGNSLTVTLSAVVLALVIALFASFALARMRFKGRRGFLVVFMIAQMAPWEVLVIAIYMLVRDGDMLNSLLPLTVFYMVMVLPFTILTLRSYVAAIPKELEESAMVDGCTRTQAFLRVIFPLLAPGLMATSLFGFITAWNEFPLVLILNKDPGAQTLPLWLSSFQTAFGDDWGATMAAASLFAVPILLLFLFLQRKAVGGLTSGAVKG